MRRYLILVGIFLFLGAIALPALIYYVGAKIVGPYEGSGEGSGNLVEFIASIYLDALQGLPTAWFLILVPAMLWILWRLYTWIRRSQLAT